MTPGFKATQIVNAVGFIYGINPKEMRSRLKGDRGILARQAAAYLIREDVGASLPWIGHFLNQDHSTVFHNWRKIKNTIEGDTVLRETIAAVRSLYPKMAGDILLPFQRSRTSPSQTLALVTHICTIEPAHIWKSRRIRFIVLSRQIATYLFHEVSKRSFSEIARFFGQNRATVLYGYKVTKNAIENDESVRNIVEKARALMTENDEVGENVALLIKRQHPRVPRN